jgi:uncharacterized protein
MKMAVPILSHTLRPGEKWSGIVGRGKLLRLTALGDNANLGMLLFNADDCAEKYNMPDTLKAQHTAKLARGYSLFSDNGRVLASIVADTVGWHDTISGYCTRADVDGKFGRTCYQDQRNDWLRSGEENFLVELVRHGLCKRDLTTNVNLFAKVTCDDEGNLRHDPANCPKDASVTLRTEMKVLFILSNTPNPLDESTNYPAPPIRLDVYRADLVGLLDECVNHSDESRRAFENTWEYYALME